MLKNILNFKGAQQLDKTEQSSIHGGTMLASCSDLRLSTACRLTRCRDYCNSQA